jgi:hypothetical protein
MIEMLTLHNQSFYKYRNPLVGLLDPVLHTPQFVRSSSFTLFSVICALGCAMSERARDNLLCSALVALAEGNIKWSIAASVRTVETIQAIINMTYWAPLSERQCDDPYWLRLTHVSTRRAELWEETSDLIASVGSTNRPRNGTSSTGGDRAENRRHRRALW